ncbi:hypothetical protein [Methylobacterium frigidaeris]|uniref:Adenylate cyclase n=1 Tax=Methylobacterium frigidaeris TaxID=2038277 RepID=A0AA37H8M2_9HYPH|nr:hypothetical protein [Methylobacterium frigidaeris]PIK70745.1 hypothetical protein CS379_23030 [Methylobacterium frigidaeris]GJD61458.1 hypothetical protein MPEAHAMD_1601 [Methylobacterium frigidaeris]
MLETEEDVPADRVVETLEILLHAPPFLRSPKLARFLRFVVEEELAGRGATIKAYTIATQALGRNPDFDPSLDPSVRVEAGRLRRALDDAYAQHAEGLEVRIAVPVGGYRPRFGLREAVPTAPGAVTETDSGGPLPPAADGPGAVVLGFSPRGQAAVIALLAGILLVLCIDLGLTVSARLAAGSATPRDVAVRGR